MIQIIRRLFDSKFGVALALVLLGLIALAFAGGDIANSGGFGAFARGSNVATVGKEKISSDDMEKQVTVWVDRFRRRDPQFSLREFLAKDGLNLLLSFLIDSKATRQWGEQHGIYVSDRLIDHELAKANPQIQGPDGTIDKDLYANFLREQGLSDSQVRAETAEQIMARMLLDQVQLGIAVPKSVSRHYAGLLTEQRKGAIVTLPLAAFAPAAPPSNAEVQAYYNAHKADYALPERRTIRWVSYSDSVIGTLPPPSDAEIAARYNLNKAQYAPTDKRKLTQVILPSEAAAKAVIAEAGTGKKLEAVVAAKGLSAAPLGSLTKAALAAQTSPQAADAVFAAEAGKLAGPFKTPLGWAVIRVDARESTPGKTLEQAKPELVKTLSEEKRRAALIEYSQRIESELDGGAALGDVAKGLGLQVSETPLLTADGSVFGQPSLKVAPQLAKIVPTAFQIEGPGNAQLAEADPGKTFVIFDVGQLLPAAPPPLDQIRPQVTEDARLAKGEAGAKAAADKLKAQLEKGVPLNVAMASLGVALPPVDNVDMNRQEVEKQGASTPMPVRLLFAMPKGKVKLMRAPRNRGWYLVTVSEVTPGKLPADDSKEMKDLGDTLHKAKTEEYSAELRGAFRSEVGSSRDDDNIGKLRGQLSRGN